MTKAISIISGGEDIVSSEYIYRAKDGSAEVDEGLEETISELRNALLERHGDCVRVWSESLILHLVLPTELLMLRLQQR